MRPERAPAPLPDALRGWSPWLAAMDAHLALQLSPLLQRLQLFFGAQLGGQLHGQPETDGLGDVQRRGDYERLLHSEWLLAEDMPEEFLRRAGSQEHVFLTLQQRPRKSQRLLVVLFDAGPAQWGAARLVHLASWIVLARRVQEAGAELRWGILQQPGVLYQGHDPAQQLLRLLEQRDVGGVSPAHWQHWQQALQREGLQPAECWLIGSHLHAQQLRGSLCSHQLRVQRALDEQYLDLELQHRARVRTLQLSLPDRRAGSRLLRGAFVLPPGRTEAPSARLAVTAAPVFSLDGQQLCVPLQDEPGLMIFQVRGQGRRQRRHKKQLWSPAASALSLFFAGHSAAALLSRDQQLQFWKLEHLGAVARPPAARFAAQEGGALLPSACIERDGVQRLFLLMRDQSLLYWARDSEGGPAQLQTLDTGVLAMQQLDAHSIVYARREQTDIVLQRASINGRFGQYRLRAEGERLLLSDGPWHHHFQALALCAAPHARRQLWRIYGGRATQADIELMHEWTLDPGWQALGILYAADSLQLSLVMLSPDRCQLQRYDREGAQLLWQSPAPLLQCSLCLHGGTLAAISEQHELWVIDVYSGQCLLHSGAMGDGA